MILVSGQARYRVLNLLSQANRPTLQPILQSVLGHFEDVPLPAKGGSAPSTEPQVCVGGISFFRHRSLAWTRTLLRMLARDPLRAEDQTC